MDNINLSPQIQRQFPADLVRFLNMAGKIAAGFEQRLFLAGGAVRDLLMERPNLDLDLVVEGDAMKLAEELARLEHGEVIARSRFNTAKVRWERRTVDIAPARTEYYLQPGSLPSVQNCSDINADLIRRDFTINAMAVCLDPVCFGELIDLYGGLDDIKSGLVRILHDQSFQDDATRIWRAIRYEQRLDFKIEKHTLYLIERDLHFLKTISGDRIRNELELCLEEDKPEKSLSRADKLGVLAIVHPHLKLRERIARLFSKARGRLEPFSMSEEFKLGLLVYDLTGEQLQEFNRYLKIPRTVARILQGTLQLKDDLPSLVETGLSSGVLYKRLHVYPQMAILINLLASDSSIVKNRMEFYLEKLKPVQTALTGEKLLELGIAAGPKIKETLESLLEARLDGRVNSVEEEIEFVKKFVSAT